MIILAILACAFIEVVIPTWLFGSLDVVVELPLVEGVRSKLRVDALIFVVDQDCLSVVLALGGGCGGNRSGLKLGAVEGARGGALVVVLEHSGEIHMPVVLPCRRWRCLLVVTGEEEVESVLWLSNVEQGRPVRLMSSQDNVLAIRMRGEEAAML
jgi:hypothetical protein